MPILETQRLILRPLKMRDAHESVWQSRQYLRAALRQYRRGLPGSFAITLRQSGRMIGTIGFMWVNTDHRSAEVGYSLARDYWNQGIMTEALRAVIAFGLDTLRLHRIEAQHETDNPASGRVMAHVGMQYEGTLRQRLKNKGRYVDVALYAILQGDPRL